jgi:hypothetical protein
MVKSTIQGFIPRWLERALQRRTVHAALIRTYAAWTPHHWEWVDSLLNEHFLTQQVAPLLACSLAESRQPDPVELAEAWAEQLSWFNEAMKQRHVAKLIPAISDFLGCLEAELLAHPVRSLPPAQNMSRLSTL